jgi:hypothetical protein
MPKSDDESLLMETEVTTTLTIIDAIFQTLTATFSPFSFEYLLRDVLCVARRSPGVRVATQVVIVEHPQVSHELFRCDTDGSGARPLFPRRQHPRRPNHPELSTVLDHLFQGSLPLSLPTTPLKS